MKNIFNILYLKNIKKSIKKIFNRFPITLLIIFLFAGISFIELHYHNKVSNFYQNRIPIILLSLIMTFIFSIGTYLSTENSNINKIKRNIFQIIPIGFGIIFYNIFSLNINDFENFLFFGLSFSGILAYLFFAPYIKNIFTIGIKQSVFYSYFYNISTVLLISFIFAGILFGLGAIGITTTDTLFNLNIDGKKTYGNWAILSLSIITPLFTLGKIPNKESFTENNYKENVFYSFIIKFIGIPFIYLYFFILYSYTIKVLLNFNDWPKGEVSWLIIGFSIFGYLTYSFSYIFEEKNKTIKIFRKIFPYAVVPQIFMLFYAIYLRINQYDITVNRYFVVVFGLWLLLTSLHFIFSKKKNLIAIPTGLTLFIIIISIIPKYNIYTLPETKQYDRLENNLIKAGILNKNIVTPLKNYSDINENLSKNIYSGIEYLCDFNNCSKIKKLFPKIYAEIIKNDKIKWQETIKNNSKIKEKYTEPSIWQIKYGITQKIKVKNYFTTKDDKTFFEYSKKYDYNNDFFPINIKGYNKIYKIKNYDKWEKYDDYAKYNINNNTIEIIENGKIIKIINTEEINKKLFKRFGKTNTTGLNKKDLIFELEGGKYKLFFENIIIKNPNFKKEIDSSQNNLDIYMGGHTSGFLLKK